MRSIVVLAVVSLASACSAASSDLGSFRAFGPQAINLWRLQAVRERDAQTASSAHYDAGQVPLSTAPQPEFPEHWFTQPLDHFSSDTHTFEQRYWINTRHYKPSADAPVIVLDGGETSGKNRIPFLDTGIVEILAKATGGVGVVLEHRYALSLAVQLKLTSLVGTTVRLSYTQPWSSRSHPCPGKSVPVENFTTDSLR